MFPLIILIEDLSGMNIAIAKHALREKLVNIRKKICTLFQLLDSLSIVKNGVLYRYNKIL